MLSIHVDAGSWAENEFGNLELGDKRRNRRAVEVGKLMAQNPGASIPMMTSSEYEMKAAYNLFARTDVTPDKLQMTHRRRVIEEISKPDTTHLLIQDTTTINYSGRNEIEGLGPVGPGCEGLQGFFAHSVLAARWQGFDSVTVLQARPPVELIGLADQQTYVRKPRPVDEKRDEKNKRLRRSRESEIWGWATERIQRAPGNCDWVRICDAEADIYPFMVECGEYNHSFVIRASQNRVLLNSDCGHLFDAASKADALGSFSLKLRGRDGAPGRTIKLTVSSCRVTIGAPFRPGGGASPLECSLVRVHEQDPSKDANEPLEWVLLTDRKVDDFEGAVEAALMYSCRWLVEEFHKVLKSGLGIERLQMETGHSLMTAGAIMSVVALRLLALKENGRTRPDQPAEQSGLSEIELAVLREKRKRPIATIRDVVLGVGSLGGHKGRKCDGMPGWKTLWLGMHELLTLVEGVRLANAIRKI